MAEFLDIVETMRSEAASIEHLFGGEGTGVRSTRRRYSDEQLLEGLSIYENAFKSRRGALLLQEAMGTSDFPYLFGDIIDRQLLANYQEYPQVFRAYAHVSTVPDFRTVKRFVVNNAEARLPQVPQGVEYPQTKLTDNYYSYAVAKYGREIAFAWESMINDDLNALKDIPIRLGRAARRTESFFAADLWLDSNGPEATFCSTANKNLLSTANGAAITNAPLSIQALQDAMSIMWRQVDADGEPIYVEAMTLVVGPALSVLANNIMNATQLLLDPNATAGTAQQKVFAENWMRSRVKLVVEPYIPIICTTNGLTTWGLFADPNQGRPAMEIGFLQGHETPEVFIKTGNSQRVGGGGVDPMNGDFDTDSLKYKVRDVIGGTLEDPKSFVGSNGSGS